MTVEELNVILKIQTKEAESALKSVSSATEKTKDALRSMGDVGMAKSRKSIAQYEREIEKAASKVRSIQTAINSLSKSERFAPTSALKALQKELAAATKKVEETGKAVDRLIDDGRRAGLSEAGAVNAAMTDRNGTTWKAAEDALDRRQEIVKKIYDLNNKGGALQESSELRGLLRQLDEATEKLKSLQAQKEAALSGEPLATSGDALSSRASGIANVTKRISERFKSMGRNAVTAFKDTTNHMRLGFRRILMYAVGIRSLYLLFGKLKSAVKEGFGNLSQFSGRTSSDLAMLKGSLTQVKNSLATAFAPILTVIAPIIQTFVNLITTACNALAMFFGALTGQKTVTVAKAGLGDIAAGAGSAADATDAANGAAEEYQRTLMGFDQVNKLDDNSGSGGSGGGGAGGVGGAAGFTTAEISNAASGWADKVKEAWKNADFYGIGQSVGQRLKAGLDSIDWSRVKGIGEKIARSIATGLNGFLEAPGLFSTIGKTIAQSLNTVFNTANTFAKEFHWESLGTAISDTINTFFSTFDFTLAGQTIFNWASGILRSAISAVKNVDWALVGEKIAEFIAGIDWAELISEAIELAKLAIKGVAEFTLSFVKNIAYKLFKWAYDLVHARSEATLKVNLKGKKDKSFTKVYKEYESTNDKPATVELKGKTHYSWASTQKDFNSIKDSTATKTLRESGGSTIRSVKAVYDSIKSNSATKTVYGSTTSSMKDTKWYFDNVYNKSATMYLQGSISSQAERVYAIVTSVANKVTRIALNAMQFATGGLYSNGSWKPITAAAGGGAFNTGQMFVAREAGPELVGTIGGHTAVMNNDQIVSSVAAGVARAVASVMGSGSGQTTVVLEGDAKNLFRVVRTEAQNFTNATGLTPFPV